MITMDPFLMCILLMKVGFLIFASQILNGNIFKFSLILHNSQRYLLFNYYNLFYNIQHCCWLLNIKCNIICCCSVFIHYSCFQFLFNYFISWLSCNIYSSKILSFSNTTSNSTSSTISLTSSFIIAFWSLSSSSTTSKSSSFYVA